MSETQTYDERRANPQPCPCGRLVTRPDLCVAAGECVMLRHPAERAKEGQP